MKKRFKFTSIILAGLFATAPVFSLKTSVPNTTQAASTITKKNVITHFLGERNIYINSTKINGSASINNISLVNNSGTEIETNDTVLTDGKYTLKAQATVIGLPPPQLIGQLLLLIIMAKFWDQRMLVHTVPLHKAELNLILLLKMVS